MPFDNSRRLTGSNLFFDAPGAVLDVVGVELDATLLGAWRERVARGRAHLGWAGALAPRFSGRAEIEPITWRRYPGGASLALAAPIDLLYTATELNEWALSASLFEREPGRWAALEEALVQAAAQAATPPAVPPVLDDRAALERLLRLAALEGHPSLRAVIDRATGHGLGWMYDDEGLTLGEGVGHADFTVSAVPRADAVRWESVRNVPVALVTGSNGKTTTVRLLAACAQAQGWHAGYNCTDGVFLAGRLAVGGDFSGPMGARAVLRDARVQAAIIEAARGGILRRGLAANRADVAVVTNVSPDHFGDYGIDDLDAMAATKLVVANVVQPGGLVVLNANDPTLQRAAARVAAPIGWFATDFDLPLLAAHRARGGASAGVRAGRLVVASGTVEHDLGEIASMPLTIGGSAVYNVANIAAAALAATALGIGAATLRTVLARFGSSPADNPGRLMRFDVGGLRIVVDYAHNPEGLRGVLDVAHHLRGDGRLIMLLGQAGDRDDADIAELAATAAAARPDIVVIKETESYLRGRAAGEVPALLRASLLQHGLDAAQLIECPSEIAAVRSALVLARPGDVLLLPVHGYLARGEVVSLIGRLRSKEWSAGEPLLT